MTVEDFDYVRNFVRERSAIVLEPGKEYLVESRMLNLAMKENFDSVASLAGKLRTGQDKELCRKVVEAMTTNETSFFRDVHPFESLRRVILPELIKRNAHESRATFWCGAASTGQEPFSVMMTIAEYFPELLKWNLKFVATDLSSEVIARARSGRFSQLEVNRGLPAAMLLKYFTKRDNEWEFRADLRSRIEFREMNLVKDWPALPPLDIAFLRNVMIYFDLDSKKSILKKIRELLRPGGLLMLGGAETTFNLDDNYERRVIDKTTCYQVKQH
jgi:chemotaxis protein methyltransferase CheR